MNEWRVFIKNKIRIHQDLKEEMILDKNGVLNWLAYMLDGWKGKDWHPKIKLEDDFINLERSDNSWGKTGERDLHQRYSKENQREPWKDYTG